MKKTFNEDCYDKHKVEYSLNYKLAQKDKFDNYCIDVKCKKIPLISQELNTLTIPNTKEFDKIYYLTEESTIDFINKEIKLATLSLAYNLSCLGESIIVPRSVILVANHLGLFVDKLSYISICKEFENKLSKIGEDIKDIYIPPLDALISVLKSGDIINTPYILKEDVDINKFIAYTEDSIGKKIYELIHK